MDFDKLLKLFRALHDHGVEYVLVGGIAINLHGLVRGTDDVDLFVRPTSENVARLRSALHEVWDDPAIDTITSDDLAGEYPTIRYGPPDDDTVVDLIGSLGTAFRFEDIESEVKTFESIPVRLATPRMLFRMKRGTLRFDDQRDAQRLAERFGFEED